MSEPTSIRKKCLGIDGDESQYIYNDGRTKGRIIYKGKTPKGEDWFSCECKAVGTDAPWEGGLCGTADFLKLSEQEKNWAIRGNK